MKIQLIRHASFNLYINDLKILVDPMLSDSGAMAATPNTANQNLNPLVNLPIRIEQILEKIDAIVITHSHRDHLDDKAMEVLPKDIPVFCQPQDQSLLENRGFKNVIAIESEYTWNGVRLVRTGGQHGVGEIGQKMGPVSGFIIEAVDQPLLYLIGDSVWCKEVEEAIELYKPKTIISFAGAAQFLTGGHITMNEDDIKSLCYSASEAKVVVGHMEAWNHCLLTRKQLRLFAEQNGINNQIIIPDDGEIIEIN